MMCGRTIDMPLPNRVERNEMKERNDKQRLIEKFAFDLGRITGRSEMNHKIIHRRSKGMVTQLGAIEAACKMIMAEEEPTGYRLLKRHKLFKLTTEKLVLQSEYRPLFKDRPDVLKRAKERLRADGA